MITIIILHLKIEQHHHKTNDTAKTKMRLGIWLLGAVYFREGLWPSAIQ